MRNKILSFILMPVLFAWAVVLLLHRTEPSFYSNVVERIIYKVRMSFEIIATISAVFEIKAKKDVFCFQLFDSYSKNMIRFLELSSFDDVLVLNRPYSYNNDFAA